MATYYTPSGRLSSMAFPYFIITALVVLPILALIYAYAIWYIPFPYINFLVTGAFGLAIGLAISFIVIRLGKVRSKMWSIIFLLLGALLALYVHWAVWVDLVLNISGTVGSDRIGIATSNVKFGQVLSLLKNPAVLFDIMGSINEQGVWGIRGGTVKGGFLTFIWVVEVLLASFVAFSVGIAQSGKPFCEYENKWFDEKELAPVGLVADPAAFTNALDSGNVEALGGMLTPVANPQTDHHTSFTAFDAPTGENFISVTNNIAKTDDKGKISFDNESVVQYLKVNQEVMDRLRGTV